MSEEGAGGNPFSGRFIMERRRFAFALFIELSSYWSERIKGLNQ